MSESVDVMLGEAQALRRAGRLGESASVWRRLIARVPENLYYRHDLAAILGDDGRNEEAAAIAGDVIARGLDLPETHLVHARALAGVSDLERAESAYRRVLEQRPYDAVAHRELAQLIWMRSSDAGAAVAALIAAIGREPDRIALKVLHAELLGQMGDSKAQFEILQNLVASSGRNPEICHFAARAALACKQYSAALEYSKTACAAALEQDDVVAVHVAALLANGDPATAARVIGRLRRRQPENQYFIALQATAWRMLGDERYRAVFDYDTMVFSSLLDTPSGWPSLTAYLEDLAAALENAHCYREHPFFLSVRHGSQIASITKSRNPAMQAFAEAVRRPLEQYVAQLGAADDPLRVRNLGASRLMDAWSVLLPPNGYHVNHVHPDGWLSSACHIRAPAHDPESPRAGWLKFGEPGCATMPALKAEHYLQPEAGRLVIFPSYIWHGTEPFSRGSARLTVAADFAPATPAHK